MGLHTSPQCTWPVGHSGTVPVLIPAGVCGQKVGPKLTTNWSLQADCIPDFAFTAHIDTEACPSFWYVPLIKPSLGSRLITPTPMLVLVVTNMVSAAERGLQLKPTN